METELTNPTAIDQLITFVIVLLSFSLVAEKLSNMIKIQAPKIFQNVEDEIATRRISWLTFVISIAVAFLADLNVLDYLETDNTHSLDLLESETMNVIGIILTGVFLSRGSKFFHDLLDALLLAKRARRIENSKGEIQINDAKEVHALLQSNILTQIADAFYTALDEPQSTSDIKIDDYNLTNKSITVSGTSEKRIPNMFVITPTVENTAITIPFTVNK